MSLRVCVAPKVPAITSHHPLQGILALIIPRHCGHRVTDKVLHCSQGLCAGTATHKLVRQHRRRPISRRQACRHQVLCMSTQMYLATGYRRPHGAELPGLNISNTLHRLEGLDAGTTEARAGQLLHGLGFTKTMQNKRVRAQKLPQRTCML